MPIMQCTLPDGGKGFKWGHHGHCYAERSDAEKQAAAAHANGWTGALDSAGNRLYDENGRLHIYRTNISKACINPYYGREIPRSEELGLEPDKIYYLLRDPGELSMSASTFERNQILKAHIPVTSEAPQQDKVVGAIGSMVEFDYPYLVADVAIWDDEAIAGIETDTIREFSCGYNYVAVMIPGIFEGERYDGKMTQIVGNHLCLVEKGRAGPDVLAADHQTVRTQDMKQTKTGKALVAALGAAFPALALDSAFVPLVSGLTRSTYRSGKATILGKLAAMDAECKEKAGPVMDAITDVDEPEPRQPKETPAEDEDENEPPAQDEDETEEERKAREKKEAKDRKAKDRAAKDAEEKDKREEETRKAMDSFRAELREAEDAKRDVRPVVGEIIAQDSAADIYGFALDQMKVDRAGVTGTAALRALFKLAQDAKKAPASTTASHVIAMDSAAAVQKRFPGMKPSRVS